MVERFVPAPCTHYSWRRPRCGGYLAARRTQPEEGVAAGQPAPAEHDLSELHGNITGIVVRPCGTCGATPPQVLIFQHGKVRQLAGGSSREVQQRAGEAPLLMKLRTSTGAQLRNAWQPVYEPSTDSVYFVDGGYGSAIMRLDSTDSVSLVAGSTKERGSADGSGVAARFTDITALAADGTGGVYLADHSSIRKLDARSGDVTTLPGATSPRGDCWSSLTYAAGTDELWAATSTALCRIRPCGGGGHPEIVNCWWSHRPARFKSICSILAGADGRIYICEDSGLRSMDTKARIVSEPPLVTGTCFTDWQDSFAFMAAMPWGDLAVGCGKTLCFIGGLDSEVDPCGEWWRSAPREEAAAVELQQLLLAPKHGADGPAGGTGAGGDGGSSSSRSSSSSSSATTSGSIVEVHVGGMTIGAHRSVLSARSDYFKQLLVKGGSFADSGAAVASLPDADPEAFAALLSYMYTGSLHVPDQLLRPTVELAGRLLMPGVVGSLKRRLLAACTTQTVLWDLVWADEHNLSELMPALMARFAAHRHEAVAAAGGAGVVVTVAARSPDLAAQIIEVLVHK